MLVRVPDLSAGAEVGFQLLFPGVDDGVSRLGYRLGNHGAPLESLTLIHSA